jgi:gamma-glutamyl hercynylcysteine S-oxide hydrolase
MCRHLAYIGAPVTIASLLLDPPHSLFRQAWEPRRQRSGTLNADGFGVGWYADGDPRPARYRRAGPIWADEALPDLARVTRSTAMLCAVRSATPGTDLGASAAAPYAHSAWLFSLNGVLHGWPDSPAVTGLAAGLPAADLLALPARCDTALIWALVLARLRAGNAAGEALAGTLADIRDAGATGRFNLLITAGQDIAATAAGNSLCYRYLPDGVVVASEPFDDDDGWIDVPDGSLIEASRAGVRVTSLLGSAHQDGKAEAR